MTATAARAAMTATAARAVVLALLAVVAAGCTEIRRTQPERGANEQLLLSTAADKAIERMEFGIDYGQRVYLDGRYFDSYDRAYAIGALRAALLAEGAYLVSNRADADVIVEVRSGALSTTRSEFLAGIPAVEVPIPTTTALETPEIALWKELDRTGVAKFAATVYRSDGGLIKEVGPVYGLSWLDRNNILGIAWEVRNTQPEDVPVDPPVAGPDPARKTDQAG
ncbi:hypothetical protein CKO28_20160 [Rhodovibrio sodomensis]|uniref:Uncharacterized protein n=1 Tax=Rhodovibrio sodomensis TaxID=1088 RepID=A0ABS1DK08_9PROT|nr:DUF6655 family protein [Rhodovibrio sodomensis]MBK1670341.1 hypothetical protein [Rhodovibrio sodomensis]